jgi:hypothetical protein
VTHVRINTKIPYGFIPNPKPFFFFVCFYVPSFTGLFVSSVIFEFRFEVCLKINWFNVFANYLTIIFQQLIAFTTQTIPCPNHRNAFWTTSVSLKSWDIHPPSPPPKKYNFRFKLVKLSQVWPILYNRISTFVSPNRFTTKKFHNQSNNTYLI